MRCALKLWLTAITALVLSACSTPPTHFYTLSGNPADYPANKRQAPFVISVQPVDVPAQVDQPQLLIRVGPDQVKPMEFERWAAPLEEEIRNALAADIADDLNTSDVYSVAPPPNVPLYRIQVAVQRFDSVVGHYSLIKAAWSIQPAEANRPRITCFSREKVAVKSSYAGLIAGHQRALERLGAAISETLRSITADKPNPACPS